MKKFFVLSMAIASAIAFEGCASSTSVRVTELNSYNHSQSANIRSYGAANAQTIGPVFLKTEEPCTISELIKAAVVAYKNTSDLVNIRMEETETSSGSTKTYSCKYSALAVNYKSISPEELYAWQAFFSESTAEVAEVEEKTPILTAPVAEPQQEPAESYSEPAAETSNNEFYTR